MKNEHVKRISLEDAEGMLPLTEDLSGMPAKYFTFEELPPDQNGEVWEKVTYYSGRKKGALGPEREGRYWIYVLSNPSIPSMYKIGYTKNSPEERAAQISNSTGVATPFKVEYAFNCHDGQFLEEEVHKELEFCRVSGNREFFSIQLHEAIEVINRLGKKYTNALNFNFSV